MRWSILGTFEANVLYLCLKLTVIVNVTIIKHCLIIWLTKQEHECIMEPATPIGGEIDRRYRALLRDRRRVDDLADGVINTALNRIRANMDLMQSEMDVVQAYLDAT